MKILQTVSWGRQTKFSDGIQCCLGNYFGVESHTKESAVVDWEASGIWNRASRVGSLVAALWSWSSALGQGTFPSLVLVCYSGIMNK